MGYGGFATLSVDVQRSVAYVTIDHGEFNLMDLAMLTDLDRLGRSLEGDRDVKVVVLQSANPEFFIAHADVGLILQLPAEPPPRSEPLGWVHATLDRFRTMPKATMAKIQGRCRGGGSELALACDLRFAELGRGVLCQPEVGVGIIPGAGGSVRLPRLVGRGRAMEIILGCGDFTAELAERYGYVNRALPPGEIDGFVAALAERIASFPAEAIAAAKAAAGSGDDSLEADLAREELTFLQAARSMPARQRMAAALEIGLQTRDVEATVIEHLWGALARS